MNSDVPDKPVAYGQWWKMKMHTNGETVHKSNRRFRARRKYLEEHKERLEWAIAKAKGLDENDD